MTGKLLGRMDHWNALSLEEEDVIKDVSAVAFEGTIPRLGLLSKERFGP